VKQYVKKQTKRSGCEQSGKQQQIRQTDRLKKYERAHGTDTRDKIEL
jgi:hypothetical protein